MVDLKERVALIIGGAAGIGLASAQALAAAGAVVVIADRDGAAAERAERCIQIAGGEAKAYELDVSSMTQLRSVFDFVAKAYGSLNVLLNNVGITGPNGFDATEAQFDEVLKTNLTSHFFATRYAVPLMQPCAPRASIIYMSSAAGLRGGGLSPLYAISKAGLLMLSRTFARHLGPAGIRANALCPGHVETAFPRRWLGINETEYQALIERGAQSIPLGRIAQPKDIASVVAFLASDQSMWVTGCSIPLDGGQSA